MKDPSQPRNTVWLDVESSREAAHWLPWRPDKTKGQSEEDCEDPDRQVWLLEAFEPPAGLTEPADHTSLLYLSI